MGVLAHGSMWMGRRTQHNPQHPDEQDLGRLCKGRLEELLAFAQVYRGWTAKELAAFIGRDVHNVIPPSGIPKADLVLRLAQALDWAPGSVFEHICGGPAPEKRPLPIDSDDYLQLNREAYRAFEEGRFEDMIALGLRMERVADCPDQRAEACLRQYNGFEGLGRHEQAVDALQRGLQERDVATPLKLRMRGNLAVAYFVLGQWLESEGVANAVLARLGTPDGLDSSADGSRATALLARGLSRRSRALQDSDERARLLDDAIIDLQESAEAWRRHAQRAGSPPSYLAGAHLCLGAVATAEALRGMCTLHEGIAKVLTEIDRCSCNVAAVPRAMLESFGWWCVFGSELALELESEDPARDQLLARFTLMGLDLAEASNNWALRERLLTVDYLRWSSRAGRHSSDAASVLDREDVRLLAGAMARFPRFRPFGWELVRQATRID